MENDEIEKNNFFLLDKYFQLILERDKAIIFLIQLIIALLVIASFSDKIISNIIPIKILIAILLFLTTLMLIDYLLKLNNGLNAYAKTLGDKSNDAKKWFRKLIDGSIYLYTSMIIIIIDVIIGLIILNLLISLYAFLVQIVIFAIYIFKKDKIKEFATKE
ncbi:hypothetical protein KKG85_01380 [Patescibacteria group bacterium]|nr:hypothetical protein [Patescibacteria group bacterium]MBU2579809.1 hypothetical protein [Patescibacteria group bacterium]